MAIPGSAHFDAMQRVQAVKQGLPATLPGDMASRMGMSKERLYVTLGLPRATVERKARESKPLSPDESSRVLGIGHLRPRHRLQLAQPNAVGRVLVTVLVWRIATDAPEWEAHGLTGKGAEVTGRRQGTPMPRSSGRGRCGRGSSTRG